MLQIFYYDKDGLARKENDVFFTKIPLVSMALGATMVSDVVPSANNILTK